MLNGDSLGNAEKQVRTDPESHTQNNNSLIVASFCAVLYTTTPPPMTVIILQTGDFCVSLSSEISFYSRSHNSSC